MNKNQWKAHVEACNESGLNKSEYAKQHDLVYHNFIYWSQKLSKKPANDFVAVTVKPTESANVITKSQPVKAANEILSVVEFL
jgi:transposase-like protein